MNICVLPFKGQGGNVSTKTLALGEVALKRQLLVGACLQGKQKGTLGEKFSEIFVDHLFGIL